MADEARGRARGREWAERLAGWVRRHQWRLLLLFVGVLLPLYALGELDEAVRQGPNLGFDEPVLLYVHAHSTPALDGLMLWITRLGYHWGVAPAAGLVFLALAAQRRRGDAFYWALAVGGAALLNALVKLVFARVRPGLWLSIAPEYDFSFPSGHAMLSSAFVGAALVLAWPTRWRWPVLVLGVPFAVLVAFSRIYLGVHYPSDILAGWLASLAWVLGASLVLYGRPAKPTPAAEPADEGGEAGRRGGR